MATGSLNKILFISLFSMVPPPGIEPGSSVLQTGAMTTSAKAACLVVPTGIEPVTFIVSGWYSTTELRNYGTQRQIRTVTELLLRERPLPIGLFGH